MKLENMEKEFPEMPMDIKVMVEHEVVRQVKTVKPSFGRKKAAIAAIAAVIGLGTTVYAGIRLYNISTSRVGNYGLETTIGSVGETEKSGDNVVSVPAVKLEMDYLPEGLTDMGSHEYLNYDTGAYMAIYFYAMDQGDDAFQMFDKNVASSENIDVAGHEGIYLEYNGWEEDETDSRRMYVAYTDVHYVMEMHVSGAISKEEALKTAEGIRLTPTDDREAPDVLKAYLWSDQAEALREMEETEKAAEENGTVDTGDPNEITLTQRDMKNLHAIGDTFEIPSVKWTDQGERYETDFLKARVVDVQILDNINTLDSQYFGDGNPKWLSGITDENGVLKPLKMTYYKYGDGVDTPRQYEVDSRQAQPVLVYVTVEYTNNTDEVMPEAIYSEEIIKLKAENGAFYTFRERPDSDEWDEVNDEFGLLLSGEMRYYDARGGEAGNNYMTDLKPGETRTVHMGHFVEDRDLPYLYLDLFTGVSGAKKEEGLREMNMGLVDIRQLPGK